MYALKVVNFDIIDENEDGINEPGEHLLVHNVRVCNFGAMPSPEQRSVHLMIQGTRFLVPVASEPLELPRGIQPGHEVTVPGVLRALIRDEQAERAPGCSLRYEDSVTLVGYFNERLGRPIPSFCGATKIPIQYPLQLDAPRYLDCVSKANKVRFSWTVRNVSNRPYGIDGFLGRAVATRLTDPNHFFTLTHAAKDNPEEATDEIPEIKPNSVITIDQEFTVDDKTLEFSQGYLTLELMLSDPLAGGSGSEMRPVQKHLMHMQISGQYSLSPDPSFLLVVNSKTPNHAIHQIITLVRHRLHTSLDVFNLSLTGSFQSPVTGQSVLRSYRGRSVIVFGNRFPYFDQGECAPWDLLDPWETALLVKARTSILFASVDGASLEPLQSWAAEAIFPTGSFTEQTASESSAGALVSALKSDSSGAVSDRGVAHKFTVRKRPFGSLQSTCESSAKSAAKLFNKTMPLRRFMVVPDSEAMAHSAKVGGVIVCEGVPRNANMMASLQAFAPSPAGTHDIGNLHMYSIVSCLPFEVKARMFWNMMGWRAVDEKGVPCETLYHGLDGFCTAYSQYATVDNKVRKHDARQSLSTLVTQPGPN